MSLCCDDQCLIRINVCSINIKTSIFIKVTISATSVFEHFDDSKPTSFTDVTRLLSHESIFPKGSLSVKIEGGSCLWMGGRGGNANRQLHGFEARRGRKACGAWRPLALVWSIEPALTAICLNCRPPLSVTCHLQTELHGIYQLHFYG